MDLKGVFKIVKFKGLIEGYTTLKLTGGVYQRFSGKGQGINKDLTDDDKKSIAIGLKQLATQINKAADAELNNLETKK